MVVVIDATDDEIALLTTTLRDESKGWRIVVKTFEVSDHRRTDDIMHRYLPYIKACDGLAEKIDGGRVVLVAEQLSFLQEGTI